MILAPISSNMSNSADSDGKHAEPWRPDVSSNETGTQRKESVGESKRHGHVKRKRTNHDKNETKVEKKKKKKRHRHDDESRRDWKRTKGRRRSYSSSNGSESSSSSEDSKSQRKRRKKKQRRREQERERQKQQSSDGGESQDVAAFTNHHTTSQNVNVLPPGDSASTVAVAESNSCRGKVPNDDSRPDYYEQEERRRRRALMAPMSREEYVAVQSNLCEVYDAQSGRYRLVRGDGEIVDRIVSKTDHQRINQQATQGDGSSFTKSIFNQAAKKK